MCSSDLMELTKLLGEVGSILRNPVDVSQAWSHGPLNLYQAIEAVLDDPVIELILIQEDVDIMLLALSSEGLKSLNDFFIELRKKQSKPVVIVLSPGSAEPERLEIEQMLLKASIPVFPSMERAAKAIVAINKYYSLVAVSRSCEPKAWQEARQSQSR